MLNREKELVEYQKAQEELKEGIVEFLERNSERKHTLKEIAEVIKIPTYWKGFSQPQKEVIVSKQLSYLVKMGKAEEIEEEKEFKITYHYKIKQF